MRKIAILAIVVLVSGLSGLFAQSTGLRVGLQSARLAGLEYDVNRLRSFYIGAYHINDFAGFFGFNKGLEYSQMGFMDNEDNFRRVHTISVPLLLRAKIGPAFATAGLGANFKISESARLFGEDILTDSQYKSPFFDLPVLVGAGMKVAILTFELRYGYGLIDASKLDEFEVHNSYWQLGMAVSF